MSEQIQDTPVPAAGAEPAMVPPESTPEEDAAFEEAATAADTARSNPEPKGTPDDEGQTDQRPEPEQAAETEKPPAGESTPEADSFWTEVAKQHPMAERDIDDPRFTAFVQSDKRIAKMATSKSPAVAVELLNLFYEARDAGELDGQATPATQPEKPAVRAPADPPKPAAQAGEPIETQLKALDSVVVMTVDGKPRTIGEIRAEASDEYIATIVAIAKAMQQPAAKAETAPSELTAMRRELGEMRFWQGLEDVVPGGRKLVMTKECQEFVKAQPPSIQRLFRRTRPRERPGVKPSPVRSAGMRSTGRRCVAGSRNRRRETRTMTTKAPGSRKRLPNPSNGPTAGQD
jgi:hypothetical protein